MRNPQENQTAHFLLSNFIITTYYDKLSISIEV